MNYNLPPKDLLFKMLDRDLKLIVKNYGSARGSDWSDIYKVSVNKSQAACPRETAMNSFIEPPRVVPDQHERPMSGLTRDLKRHKSIQSKRRNSSVSKKTNISVYKF